MNKGDVLEVGPHRVRCGDILEDSVHHLMGEETADVVYSDPPWGQGNVRYWRTHNKQADASSFEWAPFIEKFASVCANYAEGPVFVEMGQRWTDELAQVMAKQKIKEIARWSVLYGANLPCDVWFGWRGEPYARAVLPESPAGLKGLEVVRRCLRPYVKEGSVVLDPCTGLGMTAKLTIELGGRFRGNELNPARLERTVDILRKRTK